MKEADKVEFVNGQIVFQSPAKNRHRLASENLFMLLHTFVRRHGLGSIGHEKLLVSLTRNDYEPDIAYWRQDLAAYFTPDLVVEVLSPSTEQIDRDTKFKDYEAHGVGEYWLVDPGNEIVEQYALRDGQFALVMKSGTGILASAAISGFSISIRAIFDPTENYAALQGLV